MLRNLGFNCNFMVTYFGVNEMFKGFVIWIYIHNEIAREDRLKKKIRRNSRYKIEQFFEKSRFL